MTLPTKLSRITELEAEQLMWAPIPMDHIATVVDHVIPGWSKTTPLKDSFCRTAIIYCDTQVAPGKNLLTIQER